MIAMMNEIWQGIADHPNYEVSTHGNIRNKRRGNLLKPNPVEKRYGYVCYEVTITHQSGKQRHGRIARLVATTFIPNPDGYPCVDHIDRNTANNRVDNLRWATHSMNALNTDMYSRSKSGYKNITFVENKQKFKVTYHLSGKLYNVGSYDTLNEAIAARGRLREAQCLP